MTRSAARRRPARILPVLATLFATAAALRIASGLGAALAQDPVLATQSVAAPVDVVAAAMPVGASGTGLGNAELIVDLRQRERALAQREAELAERETLLGAAQDRIQAQIVALETAEADLAATMALADRAAEDDILRLVAVYEAMKPEEAALVFAEMAPDFAAGFLARLRPETAAAILAGLDARLAYSLSAILAGRNALVPRN